MNPDCELCGGCGQLDVWDPAEPRDPQRAKAIRCPACTPADVPVEDLPIGDHP